MKDIVFNNQAMKAIDKFPEDVKEPVNHALLAARLGMFPANAKALTGFGSAKVIEIRENGRDGTYRCVYTTQVKDTIHVLHAFQKKSKSGSSTNPRDIEIIIQRLKKLPKR